MKTKVLIVDDSPFIRRILNDWISNEPDMEVVGTATNGHEAIDLAVKLQPDLVTLDVEMPVCDGLTALPVLLKTTKARVLMVSSVTTQGAEATIKALELGAYDFVTKPQGSSSIRIVEAKDELLEKVRAAAHVSPGNRTALKAPKTPTRMEKSTTDKVVVIAGSTGGPQALTALFKMLPKGFPAPVLIVQHMPAGFTASFAKRLDSIGTVPCAEAVEGESIVPGMALLAPGGKHMTVGPDGKIHLNENPTLHGTRPAADYLFESASQLWGNKVVGVVLTGMGRDGAAGAKTILDAKGFTIGQNQETCTIYGMPKAAMQVGGIAIELPLESIASEIVTAVTRRIARAS